MLWMSPQINMEKMNPAKAVAAEGEEGENATEVEEVKGTKLEGREFCASLFDPKGSRILYFGGWCNSWREVPKLPHCNLNPNQSQPKP